MKKINVAVCVLLSVAGLTFAQKAETMKKVKTDYKMIEIPNDKILVGATEVTQDFYEKVMGSNPSEHVGARLPVNNVSWNDAIYFCNKLSVLEGLTPVYIAEGSKNTDDWDYTPHYGLELDNVKIDSKANGYRLPSKAEWLNAAKAGKNTKFAGSDDIEEVAWYLENSGAEDPHAVAKKKPNAYGLYDMTGNVRELTNDEIGKKGAKMHIGGHYFDDEEDSVIGVVDETDCILPEDQDEAVGFRIVRNK